MDLALRELLESAGLARIAAPVERLALSSVRLKVTAADETRLPPGVSKIGGAPDLPTGQIWPARKGGHSLPFIAQLDLAEVAPYDLEGVLPRSGMLYFFFDLDSYFDTEQDASCPESLNWKVLYRPGGHFAGLRRQPMPEDVPGEERYSACTIVALSSEVTLPYYFPLDPEANERFGLRKGSTALTEQEYHAYWALQERLAGADRERSPVIHRLLGHADPIQNDMQVECHLEAQGIRDAYRYDHPRRVALKPRAADWRLLLQIDTDDDAGMMWGDCGRIYFWIQQQALARRDFSKVWLMLQCT